MKRRPDSTPTFWLGDPPPMLPRGQMDLPLVQAPKVEPRTAPCAACWAPVDVGDQPTGRAWHCSRLCATIAERIPEGGSVPRAIASDAVLCRCAAIDSEGRARGYHTPACFVSARFSRASHLASVSR